MKRNRYVVAPVNGRYGVCDRVAGVFIADDLGGRSHRRYSHLSYDRKLVESKCEDLNAAVVETSECAQLAMQL